MQIRYFSIKDKKSAGGFRKIAYTHWGDEDNDKVIFCVHGLTRNSRDFDYLAKELESDYRIICVDIIGRGNSDWVENKKLYNYFTYVSDVKALIDDLGIKQTYWVGTSMGGLIGMMIAFKNPALIKKIVMNDIGPFLPGSALDRIFEYAEKKMEFESFEDAQEELKKRHEPFGIINNEHWEHITKHSIKKREDGKYVFLYDPEIIRKIPLWQKILMNLKNPKRLFKNPDIDLWRFWKKLECPILILRGEKSDVLSKDVAAKMLKTNTNSKIMEFKNIGHAPSLMEEDQINLIKNFFLN